MKKIIHKIKTNLFSLLVLVGTPFLIIYTNYQMLFSNTSKLNFSYLAIQCIYTIGGIFLTLLILKSFKRESNVTLLFACYVILAGIEMILLTLADIRIRGAITNEDWLILPLMCWLVAYPASHLFSKFIERFNLNKTNGN